MAKVGPLRPRPLMLRFLTGPAHALVEMRSLAQESACKDLDRNGLSRAITLKATYTPTPQHASSRSMFKNWSRVNDENDIGRGCACR